MGVAAIVVTCIVAAAVIAFFVWRTVRKHRLVKKIEAETGVKVARRSFKDWFMAHLPSKRRLIQIYAALLYNANIKGFITGNIYTGRTTKYVCVPGLNCYSCPGAVGACPLGALQNALAESSVRAPLYVIGILAIFGVVFARTICGFLCPVGLGQELLYKVRTPKLKKSRVTRVLSYFKYVLLVVLAVAIPLIYSYRDMPLPAFCKYICPAGTVGGAIGLLFNPNNAAMFGMLGWQFTWKFSLLVVFIVASIFIFRFFCRFFCPLGAIYGFFNRIALIGVKVDKANCTDCGKCVTVCKMDIRRVGDHECINCGACIPACPTKAISWKGSKLFLHKSAIDEPAPAPQAGPVAVSPNGTPSITHGADIAVQRQEQPQEQTQKLLQEQVQEQAQERPTAAKKKRPVTYWLQLAAAIAASVLLVFAFIYYNLIDVQKPKKQPSADATVGYEVGELAPDFSVKLFDGLGEFKLYDNRGKLTVINFWATWCTPCVNEIPYFDRLAAERTDITVIAIHGSSTRDVQQFIDSKWGEHSLMFAQDNLDGKTCLTYESLGGSGLWPMTVVLNADGYVLYNSTNSFKNYDDLVSVIDSLQQ